MISEVAVLVALLIEIVVLLTVNILELLMISELIYTCPYDKLVIMNIEYKLRQTNENILVSEENRYAFEVLRKRKVCENLTIYDTTDALEICIIPNNEIYFGFTVFLCLRHILECLLTL